MCCFVGDFFACRFLAGGFGVFGNGTPDTTRMTGNIQIIERSWTVAMSPKDAMCVCWLSLVFLALTAVNG